MPTSSKIRVALHSIAHHHRQILAGFGLFLFFVTVIVSAELILSYLNYAALIDARLADNSLQQPAGIYAAPRRVSVGERMTRDELAERLLRAGYLEGEDASEFAAGSFTLPPNGVEIHTHKFARSTGIPPVTRVTFGQDEVARIEDEAKPGTLDAILLPPELLTADLNAKKQTRRATSFNELPPTLVKALTAVEDRDFFSHRGVDLEAIARALFKNLSSHRIREGGSTITQQLIKNQFLTPERTFGRKFAEAMMAIAIERRLTKEQIFALYCDRVYLGHSGITAIYGFKQAAQVFFGKELRELSLSETAFLAGLAQAPNRYSPHARPEEAIARRNVVLEAMVVAGDVSADEAAAAKNEQLAFLPPQQLDDTAAPHFVDYLRRELARHQVDEEDWPHLRIETTLDLDLQRAANQAVAENLTRLAKLTSKHNASARPEAALIALDPHTGEILAMVGGRDYAASQFNRVTDAMRQPGSVFKPIVYAAAMSRGISPATTYVNAPHEFEFGDRAVYRPQNFGRAYSNQPVTLREAVVRSLNVVAVDAAIQVGLGNVAEMAERLGLPRPQLYPSMALGAFEATPFDIARAYTSFANDGIRVDPFAIRTIKANGKALVQGSASKAGVLPASMAYMVTDTLADVVNRGTAARIRSLGYHGPAAGKTGTSRDAWFVGYTPSLLVVVWVGCDDHSDLKLTGGEAAVPIWADFIKRALQLRPDLAAKRFAQPAGLETVEIDPENGMLANEFCPHRQRLLLPSYLVPGTCFQHQAAVQLADYEQPGLDPAGPEQEREVDLPIVLSTDLAPIEAAPKRDLPEAAKPTLTPAQLPQPLATPPPP